MFSTEQEEFFHIHRDKLPPDFRETLDTYFGFREIFFSTEPKFFQLIHPPLWSLMQQHFPLLINTTDPEIKKHAKEIHSILSVNLIHGYWVLLNYQKDNIDLEKKYPKLRQWKQFYTWPEQPEQLGDKDRNHFRHPSAQEWEQYRQQENEKLLQLHDKILTERQQFYDIVQPVLFRLLPGLHNLEGEYWTLYAVKLRDNYEQWKTFAGRLETIIEYNLPPASFLWETKDYHEALFRKMLTKKNTPGPPNDL